uniref:Conophan vil-I'/vil-I'(O2P) n=1 Tax=Conus villepinii TaxID=257347 RepID=CONOI_CONVL|nr:RecName: Full=Conophan vil-I'/vil-I'(O2P) [Conus villepinii]
EPNSIWS